MGETPGEGFPQTPFLRLMSNKNFARCGGRPGARPLDGATFEKVDETFRRASRTLKTQRREDDIHDT